MLILQLTKNQQRYGHNGIRTPEDKAKNIRQYETARRSPSLAQINAFFVPK
jgi:hypothetical protein